MTMLTVQVPAAFDGETLRAELTDAGASVSVETMAVVGNELQFVALDESHRSTVERVVAAHVPPAPPADADEELREALAGFPTSGTPKQLADLLAGKTLPVQAAGRAKGHS